MQTRKYVSLSKLETFYDNLKKVFANKTHNHNKSEISDLIIDTSVSDVSENLVQNKAVGSAINDLKTYVEDLYVKLNTNTVLGFYCVEDVTIVINGKPTVYPANSNVEIKFIEGDTFEIVPTSNNSILTLNAFPSALNTFYPWLEGVKQFSNILFDMNSEDMYTKWNQGNQGAYQVQYAQYSNCIFWSDNPYISDVAKRPNYTLYYSSQLPLCYSTIPDNTFKSFYLAFGVNSDPNWGNKTYRDSFAKATWATQVFSYYGARTIGIFGHDNVNFNITLPKDCRGLMYAATAVENAGTFDAVNTTNFGAGLGSWREAFGYCSSLRNLYIKNLKANLNISWSPINYDSISFIISEAANTSAITISVSPYTYNLLSPSDFELATSKNITIALLTTNYIEDRRLNVITVTDDGSKVLSNDGTYKTLPTKTSQLENDSGFIGSDDEIIVNKQNKNVIVYRDSETGKASMTASEILARVKAGDNLYYSASLSEGTLHPYLEGSTQVAFFYSNYIDNTRVVGTGISIDADGNITTENYQLGHLKDTTIHITAAEREKWNGIDLSNYYLKTETDDLLAAKANYENPEFSGTMSLNGEAWFSGDVYVGSASGINKDEGSKKLATEEYTDTKIADLVNSAPETLDTLGELATAFSENKEVVDALDEAITLKANKAEVLLKIAQILTDEELTQVRQNLRFIGKNVEGQTFNINGTDIVAAANAEIFGDYASNKCTGQWSIVEGSANVATGRACHVEGAQNQALNDGCHVEGVNCIASGYWSHAEGEMTRVTSYASHAEGSYTRMPDGTTRYGTASGYASHIEGGGCHAEGSCSHSEGLATTAKSNYSHSEGKYTIASSPAQHVEGAGNIEDANSTYIHIAGNGDFAAQSNAYTLDWSGNGWFAGDVYVGSTSGINKDEGSKKLATEDYVNNCIPAIEEITSEEIQNLFAY